MSNAPKGIFPFGMQQAPQTSVSRDPMMDLFYSMGMPVFSRNAGGMTSVYQQQYDKALLEGRNPNEIMPWGKKNQDTPGDGTDEEKKPNPLRGMPSWYKHWMNTQGIYGGVKPGLKTKGLLDG